MKRAAFVGLAALLFACVRTHAVAAQPRIVSLIPSLTEDLFAIGAGSQVVGVSQYTDYPAAATHLPVVGSYASVDTERIVGLHPDLVVGIRSQAALVADIRRVGLRVVLFDDDSYASIFDNLRALGDMTGHAAQASSVVAHLRARTADLVRTVPSGSRPRCFVVLGVAPIFTVGDRSYIAELIALAGGRNAANVRDAYARYSAEALVSANPDVLIADRTSGLSDAASSPPWNALRAVRDGRTFVLPDAAILERPGPRYNDGLAWLIARIHQR